LRNLLVGLCVFIGNKIEEEDSEGSTQKRKRKKKRIHFQSESHGPRDADATLVQSMNSKPEATQRQASQAHVADEPRAEAVSSPQEESSHDNPPTIPMHSKRKRPKKRSLKAHRGLWKASVSPLEDLSRNGPSHEHPQGPAARGSLTQGTQVLKRKRKLGALPVNGTDLAPPAWPSAQKAGPPTSPVKEEDSQTTLPQFRKPQKKKAEPTNFDLQNLSSQKIAILKKRKKMKEMSNLVEYNGALEFKVKQIPVLVSGEGLWAEVLRALCLLGA
jgi:ribosomal RNA-processing protein 1